MTDTQLRQAFNTGFEAGMRRKSIDDNPYCYKTDFQRHIKFREGHQHVYNCAVDWLRAVR